MVIRNTSHLGGVKGDIVWHSSARVLVAEYQKTVLYLVFPAATAISLASGRNTSYVCSCCLLHSVASDTFLECFCESVWPNPRAIVILHIGNRSSPAEMLL